ncbi:MAG: hemerythrin domain-containing protein [Burkholderiaceae bacterium]|nr:hemerythrin domain-containing protein [Burkholderiaceae bacterium]
MSSPIFDTAPDFDQPIAVLKHCHDRIRKQLTTLQELPPHLAQHGSDAQARQAAVAVLRYFEQAAPNHHADEEQDLLPMLHACAIDADAQLLEQLVPDILHEHVQMEAAWQTLARQLRHVADGSASELAGGDVRQFVDLYTGHMEKEEAHIAPMAKRLFDAAQMAQLGLAMKKRRNIDT